MNYDTSDIELRPLPDRQFDGLKKEIIFKCSKWDPQVGDQCTISKHAIILSEFCASKLKNAAESLYSETLQLERNLVNNPRLAKGLGMPFRILKLFLQGKVPATTSPLRIMRFDFHPTTEGWKISEVNSDVPGGYAEASELPLLIAPFFPSTRPTGNPADAIASALKAALPKNGRVALVHATSYSDDRQVMHYLSKKLLKESMNPIFIAPDHIRWDGDSAFSIAIGQTGKVNALIRFFPAEWLRFLPSSSKWKNYFSTKLPCCNPTCAILSQSKRIPLVWNEMKLDLPVWKNLLPETKQAKRLSGFGVKDWILKPAYGRVGNHILIPGSHSKQERKEALISVLLSPESWILQRKFNSIPLVSAGKKYHLCLGVFVVNGIVSGYYGRLNEKPRIDQYAQEAAVLLE